MANPYDVAQNFSTTLNVGGGINSSQTTGIVLTSVTGLPTDGGILCFDWASTLDTSVAEYIEYTSISGNTLGGVIRGVEGIAAKAHSNAAVIAGVVTRQHIKRLRDKLTGNDAVAIQDTNGNSILSVAQNASAVNQVTITNAATTANPLISATGTDTNIGLDVTSKGTGSVTVWTGNKARSGLVVVDTASSVNQVTLTPAATGSAPQVSATGTDTNIDLNLVGKGTGKINFPASYGAIVADTDGATVTFNMATGNRHGVTLGGNRTLAVSNVSAGQFFIIRLLQDGTGSRTVTWFSTITWAGGSAPTLTTTASKADMLGFYAKTSTTFDGFVVGQNI